VRKIIAAVVGAPALVLALGLAPSASAAAPYVYYYSGPVECQYPGNTYNYVLVLLKVVSTNRKAPKTNVNRAFQILYGNALAAQRDNSEVITQVQAREYNKDNKPVGSWYTEDRPNDKGGVTRPMPSSVSPWLPAKQWAHETVKVTNEHGDVCTVHFSFHR
jgi:hypothetical protein